MFGKSRYLATGFVLAAVLLSLSGCTRPVTTEEFSQSYTVRSNTIIDINNPNGSVTVSGWSEDKVEINAIKSSNRGQEALDQVDIYIDISNIMTIATEHPAGNKLVNVNYEIKLPADIYLGLVECANGNIDIDGLTGNPYLVTSNGNITARNINGVVSISGSNGNINVTGSRGLGTLQTSNGSILAELTSLHNDVNIETSNGSITFLANPSLAADLAASTSNGSISIINLTVDASEMEQTSLTGSMNGGGHRVILKTSNGSIELGQLK